MDWCQSQGKCIQTIIIITLKPDKENGMRRRPRLTLGCEKSEVYCKRKNLNKRECCTKKCDCAFKLRCVNVGRDKWKIKVECGIHNNELSKTLVGHPYAGRLSKKDWMLVVDMIVAEVKPKEILNAIKWRHKENASIARTIYNAKANMRTHVMEGRSAMQQLLKVLVNFYYVYWHRGNKTTNEVLNLFWVRPESILLAKCFPTLVLVDCTYKTNRYKMSLFVIVGIISTGKSFSIAHCFMHREVDDNYRWVLLKLKMLYLPHEIPNVFITDKESTCINAINNVFPEAQRMLCTFHISKCVQQHCKMNFKSDSIWEKFFQTWSNLTRVTSKVEFFEGWTKLKKDWASFLKCIEYLSKS